MLAELICDKRDRKLGSSMPSNIILCRSLAALLLLLFAVGCGEQLTGKVTVDGMEVNVGTLRFNPDLDAGNDGPMVYADVKDGVYHLHDGSKITPGKNDISLTVGSKWLKSKGKDMDTEGNVATTDLIQSVDIPNDGSLDLEFDSSANRR